jgi:hypothetical protein
MRRSARLPGWGSAAMNEWFSWLIAHPLNIATIAATVAIIAAHIAHRACSRADAALSRAAATSSEAMRLASVAAASALLAIERLSASRASARAVASAIRASSLRLSHSMASPLRERYRPAASVSLTVSSSFSASSLSKKSCGVSEARFSKASAMAWRVGPRLLKMKTPNVKSMAFSPCILDGCHPSRLANQPKKAKQSGIGKGRPNYFRGWQAVKHGASLAYAA